MQVRNPLVSIITASFNSSQTIKETIESVYGQSYGNYQYIIIDGGSTDGTVEIIKSYESKFEGKLEWISEKDSGIYDAWNKGLKMVKGEWVCFLGSDDLLCPNALSDYVSAINSNPEANFISSRVELVDNDLKHLMTFGRPWSKRMKTYSCIAHVGSFHKMELFRKHGSFSMKYKICADYDFLLRVYDDVVPAFFDVVTARMRNAGVSNVHPYLVYKETYRAKNEHGMNTRICNYAFYLRTIVASWIKRLLKFFGFHVY